jgi:hypothetical protein
MFRKFEILNFNRKIFQYSIYQIIIPFIFGVWENIQRVTSPRSCSSWVACPITNEHNSKFRGCGTMN